MVVPELVVERRLGCSPLGDLVLQRGEGTAQRRVARLGKGGGHRLRLLGVHVSRAHQQDAAQNERLRQHGSDSLGTPLRYATRAPLGCLTSHLELRFEAAYRAAS